MSASQGNLSQTWKRPDELLKLHRLKQKKKQLAARFNKSLKSEIKETDKAKLLEAVVAQKRKNPFAKSTDNAKKAKVEPETLSLQDDSLLDLINTPTQGTPIFVRETPTRPPPAKLVLQPFDAQKFSKLLHQNSAAEEEDVVLDEQKYSKHLPMDWSIKTRVRFFCRSELPATTLKTSQMASSLTSCVRCIDTQNTSNGLDISPATRFNQATYYWQHPHLPWLTMFPRNSKENTGIQVGERERKALVVDWDHSFQGLFQLLRARQCPYFYLCCNTFTVLFRAAGTGGRAEIHALMSPTTRGMRSALRQEGIEYSMPLKKNAAGLNKSADNSFSTDESNSTSAADAPIPTNLVEVDEEPSKCIDADAEEDDDEDEDWLKSLGVDENEIRRINTAHTRQQKAKEMADDFSDNSLVLIEGVECQGFFSFLLNAKSTIPTVGRLAGVPPTLFAPVAFPKATLQHLTTRSNKVRMDGVDYCSIEVKGVVMPTFLPYICALLGETKSTFSATLATSSNTLAFSKATQKLLEDPKQVEEDDETAGHVFGQENLSDCGLTTSVIESMCRTGADAVGLLERACFDKERGYAWS